MYKTLEGQSDDITKECIEIAYFMRGAVPYQDFKELTPRERRLMGEFLSKRLETEGKRHHPVY
jgi:hypothetical protein